MSGYARGYDLAKVAVLAVAASIAFVALFFYMTNRGLDVRRSDVFVRLSSASGLRKGDQVVYRGVEVGKVRELSFAEMGDVVVRARLLEPVPLTTSAHAELVAIDLFGRQSLVLRDGLGSTIRLPDGDTIPGSVPASMTATVAELGAKADRIVGDTTVELMRAVLTSTAAASRQLAALTATLERVVVSQQISLTRFTEDAAGVAHNLRVITAPQPLLESSANLQRATARMDTTAQRLSGLLAQLEQGNGSLGLLLRDPALYQRGEAVLTSVEALVKDVKANPKRYINVKVF